MHPSFVRGLAAASFLAVVSASTADAQMATSRLGLNAGIALPTGDLGDVAGLGFHVGGHIAVPLKNAASLRFDADYGLYSGDGDSDVDNASLLGGMANLVFRIATTSEFKPYVLGGLGFYRVNVKQNDGDQADDSALAFNVGIGYDFMLGSKSLFTELRYLSITTDGFTPATMPIVIGLRF